MAVTSSPHELLPWTGTLTSVPLPVAFDERQRQRTFFESRISRSWPPTARNRGVATVVPPALVPARATSVAFLFLRSMR